MTGGPGPAAPQIPQRGTVANSNSTVSSHRHLNVADAPRPKRASKYGLLAPEDLVGDPAATEIQEMCVLSRGHHGYRGPGQEGDRDGGPDRAARALNICS